MLHTGRMPVLRLRGEELTGSNQVIELEPHAAAALHRSGGLFFIGLAVAGANFAMAIQMAINTNFLVDTFGISASQMGSLEAIRESCGIIAFAILALLSGLAEPLVGSGMLLMVGIGLAAYCFAPFYFWVIPMSLVWSQGLHVWMPLPNSMTLGLAEPGKAGTRLGQVASTGAAGSFLGLGCAVLLTYLGIPMKPLWIIAGAAAVFGAAACMGVPRAIKTPRQSLAFRRKYSLYYVMCFLEGWRKQIFLCFASYLLVKKYETSLPNMLILWAIAQPLGYVVAPRVGKLIDRIGEKPVLLTYYAAMIVLFVGYAFVPVKEVLYVLFIADSVLFTLALGLTTYVNHLAPPQDRTQTLSAGVAANHVAAVVMPLVGGILWAKLGFRWPFFIGILAATLSIMACTRLPSRMNKRD